MGLSSTGRGFARGKSYTAGLMAVVLLLAAALVGSGGASGVQPAAAASCSISPGIIGNPRGPFLRATVSWSNCSTNYHNTLAIYEQIGYNDWTDVYGETMPPLASESGASIPTFAGGVGCVHGVGFYEAVAYIGGITKWSSGIYCP